MRSKPKILVLGSPLDYVDQEYLDEFVQGYCIDVLHAKDRAEVKARLPNKVAQDGPFHALVIKMGTIPYEPFDEDLLGALSRDCAITASASAGFNEFDIPFFNRRGMWFCNAVNGVSEATADMAIFLILAVVRNTTNAERQARMGGWKTGLTPSADPNGKVLGIVGLGGIGRYVAKKAAVFGMRVLYHNRRRLDEAMERELQVEYCANLHDLLGKSDIVSLHTPLNADTTNLISHEEFAAMKDGAYLVNTARGAIVDEQALIQALESGKVARAGLDVFPQEPSINEYFMKSDKVVIQPHMGGLTESSFAKSQQECLENIRAYFETGVPNSPVNDPRR